MRLNQTTFSIVFPLLLWFAFSFGIAHADTNTFDKSIAKFIKNNGSFRSESLEKRLKIISQQLLNKPYLLGPLGEGNSSVYDKNPLYRLDVFDCLTFVETVIAFAHAKNLETFQKNMLALRYQNNQPRFVERNHFMSTDWNRYNRKKGFIDDITEDIFDKNGYSVANIIVQVTDKPAYFKRLIKDKQALHSLKVEQVKLAYIPLTKLFNGAGEPDLFIFEQIPSGSLVEIVRPNWNTKQSIGTNISVSHVGFVFKQQNTLVYRHASSLKKVVSDDLLIDYLKRYRHHSSVKGINVQRVL